MREADIWTALKGLDTWQNASIPCKDGFIVNAMKIRYSPENLVNAFGWYYYGWLEALGAVNRTLNEV